MQLIDDLAASLNKPSLRLELLQYILGLDTRYTRPLLIETAHIANECVGRSMGGVEK